jgi:hypothetical protein
MRKTRTRKDMAGIETLMGYGNCRPVEAEEKLRTCFSSAPPGLGKLDEKRVGFPQLPQPLRLLSTYGRNSKNKIGNNHLCK